LGLNAKAVVVGFVATVSVNGGEVLAAWLASPLYVAVRERLPGDRLEVKVFAVPALRVLTPTGVPPSKKVTVPVAPAPVTVAVMVTAPPTTDGFGEAESVVVVGLGAACGTEFDRLIPVSPGCPQASPAPSRASA